MTEPKSVVLPLHHGSIRKLEGKDKDGKGWNQEILESRAADFGLLASGFWPGSVVRKEHFSMAYFSWIVANQKIDLSRKEYEGLQET